MTKKRYQKRRDRVFDIINGIHLHVPCYVCGKPVPRDKATLEHIIPLCKGGTNEMRNLSISHWKCNKNKGNKIL